MIADAVKSVISSAVEAIVPADDRRPDHVGGRRTGRPRTRRPRTAAVNMHPPAARPVQSRLKGRRPNPLRRTAAVKAPAPAASSKTAGKKDGTRPPKAPAPS